MVMEDVLALCNAMGNVLECRCGGGKHISTPLWRWPKVHTGSTDSAWCRKPDKNDCITLRTYTSHRVAKVWCRHMTLSRLTCRWTQRPLAPLVNRVPQYHCFMGRWQGVSPSSRGPALFVAHLSTVKEKHQKPWFNVYCFSWSNEKG